MEKISSKPIIKRTGDPPAPDSGYPFEATIAQDVRIKGIKAIASCKMEFNGIFRAYLIERLKISPSNLEVILRGMKISVVVE